MVAGIEPLRCARNPLFYPICALFETPGGAAGAVFRIRPAVSRRASAARDAQFPAARGGERQYPETKGCRGAATGAPARGVH
ncbi:hypothetical protein E4F39_17010 [Burkholderia pseudomallei]|nr:hypothetical protein BURPSS13_M0010 [Burkholderia pseudomallei S13]MPT65198.1 hypothetical protein [Burkholderia pseudomallei]MPT71857.1 hypothetical protein [Burkholderia pseudomallei]MPT78859.1 hypothetical protein [Burkholderia pseudomallei]MPT86733.1 hypothetical protein [Burkholderia pseudomallei]